MTSILAITMRVSRENRHGEVRDAISQEWWRFLETALPGMQPVPLPNHPDLAQRLMTALNPAGLLLTGGNDIGACLDRDGTEAMALAWMRQKKRPVLGICRGMQFIVHAMGGRVTPMARRTHAGTRHDVRFDPAFIRQFHLIQVPDKVNSFHLNRIALPDDGYLTAKAWCGDGEIEAVHSDKEKILGLMWHPEREDTFQSGDLSIFKTHFYQKGRSSCAQ